MESDDELVGGQIGQIIRTAPFADQQGDEFGRSNYEQFDQIKRNDRRYWIRN